MKYLSKYMFLIIGALVMSLVLWFIFIGKNVTFSNYTQRGAAFEQMWYLAETPIDCFVRDDLSGTSDEADGKPVSLRRFMQDYWVVNSGFHGLESQIVCEDAWYKATTGGNAAAEDSSLSCSFWTVDTVI